MTSITTLELLLDHRLSERDAALAGWHEAGRHAAAAAAQVQQLAGYRDEYASRWSGRFARQADIEVMRHYQSYVARLDQAIAQQRQAAVRTEAQLQAALGRLRERELHVSAIERLLARRRAALLGNARRMEQKVADEAAQRSAANRPERRLDFSETFAATAY